MRSTRFRKCASVVSHIGRNDDGTDPWTPSHMEAAVRLHPYSTWPAGETKQDLMTRMSAQLDKLPGFEIAFSQPIMDSVLDYVFDPHSALAVKVFGDDFNELRRIGNAIIGASNTVPGVTDAAIDQYTPLPQISIKVDRAATARYGINVADVVNLISTGIGGSAVSQLFLGERHYDITVRFPAEDRNNPEAIKNLVLTSSDGALIPLSAGRRGQAADRRKHDQSRDESPLSSGEAQLSRSRSAVRGGGRFESNRAKGHLRPAKISHRMGRPARRTSSAPRRASG